MKRQNIMIVKATNDEGLNLGWIVRHGPTEWQSGPHRSLAVAKSEARRYLRENGLLKAPKAPREASASPKGSMEIVGAYLDAIRGKAPLRSVGQRRRKLVESIGEPMLNVVLVELERLALTEAPTS